MSRLAEWFPAHRLADGGWNCEAEEGNSTRSSFHSTLNAVRGLLAYERITGDTSVRAARHGGEQYLLERRLLFRATTGEPVGEFVREFVYPNRHRYSALAALDHFRDAFGVMTGARRRLLSMDVQVWEIIALALAGGMTVVASVSALVLAPPRRRRAHRSPTRALPVD